MIVLNEKDYAIKHLESGDVEEKPFYTLSMIAKYYYHCLGYKKSKINKLLNEFMQKNYFGYQNDKLTWAETIDKIVAIYSKPSATLIFNNSNGIL